MALLLDTIAPSRLVPLGGIIIDAGAGDGRLTRPLMEQGYKVFGVELHDRNADPVLPITTDIDFLTVKPTDIARITGTTTPPAAVITNPPFALSDDFIRHGLTLLPDGGEIHALLRHSWMTAIKRRGLLPCLGRVIMARRLKMLPADREHDDKGFGGAVDFSWFTFTKGETFTATQIVHAVHRTSDE